MRYVSTGQVLQTWKNKTSVYKIVYIIYWSVYFDTQSRLAAVSEKAFASGNPPLTYSYQWFWWLNGLEDLPTYSASIYPVLFRLRQPYWQHAEVLCHIRNFFHDTSLCTYYNCLGLQNSFILASVFWFMEIYLLILAENARNLPKQTSRWS